MINEQKRSVEWSIERDHPCHIGAEQELETKPVEDGTPTRIKSRLSLVQQWDSYPFMDGSAEPNRQEPVTPSSHSSLFSDLMQPRLRERYTHGRTKSPSQIATPPANTDSDEDKELPSVSNDGPATSPGHVRVLSVRRMSRAAWVLTRCSLARCSGSGTIKSHLHIRLSWMCRRPILPARFPHLHPTPTLMRTGSFSVSNSGSVDLLKSQPCSPWVMDESSDPVADAESISMLFQSSRTPCTREH
jgi:hypothetical protein